MLLSPLMWIVAQGAGQVCKLTTHRGLYEAFARGEDGLTGRYADLLLSMGKTPEQMRDAIARLRELQSGPPSTEPMPCVLNCEGEFELLDGHHRAARLAHDGAAFGRVALTSVSPLWQQMVDSLAGIYQGKPQKLYQEIEHPYFDCWEVSRSPDRIDLVFKALADIGIEAAARTGTGVLEIGSCTGRFCREFARRGWRVFGIDLDPRVVAVAEYLNTVFRTTVSYSCTREWDPVLKGGFGWDVIVCLSVLHGFHTGGDRDGVGEKLRRLLDRCKVLITDGDVPGREYGGGTAWPQAQYQEWLQELARSTHEVHHVGTTEGRAIYRCSRRI